MYSFRNPLLAEQALLLDLLLFLLLTFGTSSARSLGNHHKTNERDSGCIQANEMSSFSHRLPSSISWIKPQPSNPDTNASFMNKGLLCQLHRFLRTPGCRNRMRAPGQLGSWQGSNSNGFVVQPETDLLNHLLATADPNPWKHLHLAPRDRNWDLSASRVHTLLL